jgi:hypothetical protein
MQKYEATYAFEAQDDTCARLDAHAMAQTVIKAILVKLTREESYMREIPAQESTEKEGS